MTKIGIHISKHSIIGDYKTIGDAVNKVTTTYSLGACQIFTHGPESRKKNNYDADLIRAAHKVVYVHSTYMTDGYWAAVESGDKAKLSKYYKHIQDQINSTDEVGGIGLVIHITRTRIPIIKKGAELLAKELNVPPSIHIIFEFRAMKPGADCSYEKASRINELAKALAPVRLNWAFCIDTSHMWSSGIKMGDIPTIKKWLRDLNCVNRIAMIHLNAASHDTFGIGKDVHIIPFTPEDHIWGYLPRAKSADMLSASDYKKIKASTIGLILKWAKKNNITIMGEFKRGTKLQLQFALDVIAAIMD